MSLTAPPLAFSSYNSPFTPQNYGRPSSPLNPYSGSSSPLTSPTPATTSYGSIHHLYPIPDALASASGPSRPPRMTHRPFSLPSPSSPTGSGSSRYGKRPTAPSRQRSSLPPGTNQVDLFTEGTSPVQGQMWRDRLSRRMEERERRKRAREGDMSRRRGSQEGENDVDQEEADRRAQQDDEEIFRRLMVLQRRKAQHAALVSLEDETGGSDPLLPDFWEDDLYNLQVEERVLMRHWEDEQLGRQSPQRQVQQHQPHLTPPLHRNGYLPAIPRASSVPQAYRESSVDAIDQEEEDWAAEAAAAEEAERKAEEAEILDRVEREYGLSGHVLGKPEAQGDMDMDVDWDELDRMDMD